MNEFLKGIIEELNNCQSREEKIETLIYYGKQLKEIPLENFKAEDKVAGCTSETYLKLVDTAPPEGAIVLGGRSDSLIVKGYLYILSEAYKGYTHQMIRDHIQEEITDFIEQAGIDQSIMPSRTNTILNLVTHIKNS
jgi:cysteine desulfuration protein SufE